jgi:Methylase of chemotaxis methyl-accepting proteins
MAETTGIDFSLYREKTVQRRIMRRLALRNIASIEEYATQLKQDPGERSSLQRDLLISVTSFFRDPESFDALTKLVFPAIVHNRPAGTAIRSLGARMRHGRGGFLDRHIVTGIPERNRCSIPRPDFRFRYQRGGHREGPERQIPGEHHRGCEPGTLKRYFARMEGGYRVSKALRELCVFSRHNLIDDPPFAKLDLISCRNVLIYLARCKRRSSPCSITRSSKMDS